MVLSSSLIVKNSLGILSRFHLLPAGLTSVRWWKWLWKLRARRTHSCGGCGAGSMVVVVAGKDALVEAADSHELSPGNV